MEAKSPLWTWNALCEACDKSAASGPDINGISIDTRSLQPGELFVALLGDPGPQFHSSVTNPRDGHDFVEAAEIKGAAALMVSRPVSTGLPLLKVDNTLQGLWQIGAAARQRMGGKVVAITGSSGKTTARTWLEIILERQGLTHASRGSLNNHWGLPLSLARMPADSRYAVFEIGTNHPGEIAPLSQLATPDVALLLNVLPAHIGQFDGLSDLRNEKLSITTGLKCPGTLVVHDDVELPAIGLTGVDNLVTFGFDDSSTVSGQMTHHGESIAVTANVAGEIHQFLLTASGEHRVLTSLACLAVVHALGADLADACVQLPGLVAPPGRGNLIEVSEITIIDDSYNANPVSMGYALDQLERVQGGRRIALLGEMLELGVQSEQHHLAVLSRCQGLDGVITFGEGFALSRKLLGDRCLGHYPDVASFDMRAFVHDLEGGDTLLVKGSNKVFWINRTVDQLISAINLV